MEYFFYEWKPLSTMTTPLSIPAWTSVICKMKCKIIKALKIKKKSVKLKSDWYEEALTNITRDAKLIFSSANDAAVMLNGRETKIKDLLIFFLIRPARRSIMN